MKAHFFQPRMLRWIIPIGLVLGAVVLLPIPTFSTPQTRYITLDSRQFEYLPNRLHVQRDDTVIITLRSLDVVHGFYLDGYGIERRVEPGISQTIQFVADRTGKFRYRCSVSCGTLHPFMIGELVVGPNLLFWRAVGIIVVSLVGMLVYLWQAKGIFDDQTIA